jgi:hypothetical protein
MAWMRTTGYCANEDYSFSRREIHPGLSVSFTSQIQMGTSSASQSCWLDEHKVRIGPFYVLFDRYSLSYNGAFHP